MDMYDNEIPESTEGFAFLALAYTSAGMPFTSISWELDNWDQMSITVKFPRRFEPEKSDNSDTGVNAIVRGREHANGEFPDVVPGNASYSDYGKYTAANIAKCPDPESRKYFRMVFNGRTDWKQFYIDFLNAYQSSGLSQGHVESYMKWCKVVGIEGEYISKEFGKLAGGAPLISTSTRYRNLLKAGKWTEYRSTFASIIGIIKKMFNELPNDYMAIFTLPTRNIVDEAIANSSSEDYFRRIPVMVLAYAYCWNLVTERNLKGLWSGKRVYEDLPINEQESMVNILKQAKSKIKVWKGGLTEGVKDLPRALKDV